MVYVVKSRGVTVELTRNMVEASEVFASLSGPREFFAVYANGTAKLIERFIK